MELLEKTVASATVEGVVLDAAAPYGVPGTAKRGFSADAEANRDVWEIAQEKYRERCLGQRLYFQGSYLQRLEQDAQDFNPNHWIATN